MFHGVIMRKQTVRNGLRLIFIGLSLILAVSFYHSHIATLFYLSPLAESNLYRYGIFWGTALGGYGVVVSVFGFLLSAGKSDFGIRLFPWLMMIVAMISLFFYLLSASFDTPADERQRPLRPGETITI